jgi:phage terminase large subunit
VPFWRDKSKVILLTGSAGGGKSRAALEKVNGFMLKYPNATGLMLRKAREYAGKSLVPMMRRTVTGNDPQIAMLKSDSQFVYPNGSVLYWGGMKNDEQREALRSIGGDGSVDIIFIEEATAFSEDDFNELLARLRGKAAPWRQIILATNPDAPSHWIYKRLILGGGATVYTSSAADNPANPPDYLETLASLTGVLGLRLRDGKWVQAEGAVYDDFDPKIHAVDYFTPPPSWRRIRAVDFGYVNPFVCQWWALDEDQRMYLYREIYMSHTLVEDHARVINAYTVGLPVEEWNALDGADQRALSAGRPPAAWLDMDEDEREARLARVERIEATVADHDAEDRATLERYGIVTVAAKKDLSLGIQAVQQRLRTQEDGRPRLSLLQGALVEEDDRMGKHPRSTLEEFPAYVWKPVKDGEKAKEEPVDLDNHGLDATRYAVMYVDNPVRVTGKSNPFYG